MPRRTRIEKLVDKFAHLFRNWDRLYNTAECPHCDGGKKRPSSDGRTECGFCDKRIPRTKVETK